MDAGWKVNNGLGVKPRTAVLALTVAQSARAWGTGSHSTSG